MKKIVLKFLFFLITTGALTNSLTAQEFSNLDKSPHDIVYFRANKISAPQIKVLYGRPLKKNRDIFGSLIPFGKVWRVGANEATEIKFYEDVMFGDQRVKAGAYVLYAIPSEKEWTLILSSNVDVWGSNDYQEKYDIARATAKVSRAEPIEAFSIGFKDKSKYVNMILGWDSTRVTLPITLL
jgi:hypothetical protein